jgi:anthranilate/para-aminobenzoate synthase component II
MVERESLPEELEITAETDDGSIMGIRHKKFPVEGIQFHPESILTIEGKNIIKNWLAS